MAALRIEMGDAHLLEQCQIIFDMPVVDDLAVFDLHKVGGDEIDLLAVALRLSELAGEMAGEFHVHGDVTSRNDHLFYPDGEAGHRAAELPGAEGRSLSPLRPPRRQRAVR